MKKRYNYIIQGAGASGLWLAYWMHKEGLLDDKTLLIVESDKFKQNDRTWCFWGDASIQDLSFVVVFCFWHALQSMQYQLDYVRVNYNQNRKKTLMGFVTFGLMALVGMAFLLRFDLESNLGFAFVLLSLVTLPHVVVMDGLYRNHKHD